MLTTGPLLVGPSQEVRGTGPVHMQTGYRGLPGGRQILGWGGEGGCGFEGAQGASVTPRRLPWESGGGVRGEGHQMAARGRGCRGGEGGRFRRLVPAPHNGKFHGCGNA